METLKDKAIIVTGAGDGMGREIAIRLAKEGARIALVGRTEEKLAATLAAIGNSASRSYACDLRDAQARAKTVERIAGDFGGIDALVNNAGVWHLANPLDELEEQAIDDVMEVNLTGLMKFTRLILPHLRKRPEAAIVNIVSKQALRASAGRIAYAASKWGLRGFTEALKEDLKGTAIRVSGVYPAGTRTHLFAAAGEERPMETYTEPRDIAEAVHFILTRKGNMWVSDMFIDHP